jgi:hypothetical protein
VNAFAHAKASWRTDEDLERVLITIDEREWPEILVYVRSLIASAGYTDFDVAAMAVLAERPEEYPSAKWQTIGYLDHFLEHRAMFTSRRLKTLLADYAAALDEGVSPDVLVVADEGVADRERSISLWEIPPNDVLVERLSRLLGELREGILHEEGD